MRRLSGLDAMILGLETPTTHQHTLKIAVVVGDRDHPFDLDHLRRRMERRLHLLAPLRCVLAELPGLHHPVWLENCEVDFDYHLREVPAPAPGGPRELDEVISRIVSSPLDRSRPLWEMHAVTGLADGRVALVTKIHHALADGLASANLLATAVMSYPDEELAEYVAVPPDRLPGTSEALRLAAADHARNLRALPKVLRGAVRGVRRVHKEGPPPTPYSAEVLHPPRIFTNGALRPERGFASATLPLEEVQRVRRALGITMNDAILAMAAGAMRRLLVDRGDAADDPLVAIIPISVSFDTDRITGNRLGFMLTSLPVQVSDPVQRCRAASAAAKVAKEQTRLLGPTFVGDLVEYVPRRWIQSFSRRASETRRSDHTRPQANLIVSNVPGPKQQIRIAGYPVIDVFSVGALNDGCGLNITVWSYHDRLEVAVLTDANLVPRPDLVTAAIADAFEEIRDAVSSGSPVPPARA